MKHAEGGEGQRVKGNTMVGCTPGQSFGEREGGEHEGLKGSGGEIMHICELPWELDSALRCSPDLAVNIDICEMLAVSTVAQNVSERLCTPLRFLLCLSPILSL